MNNDPILHLLGLARKAGKLEIGEEPVGALCRSRHARLILLAGDAAANTCRRAAHFGDAGNALWLSLPFSKEELGFALGRTSCAMLAFSDAGMAASLVDKLALRDPERYGPAAQQLRTKADKMLQRQREKRQHEKNLREGKRKPWAPPPTQQKADDKPSAPHSQRPPRPKGDRGRPNRKSGGSRPTFSGKGGSHRPGSPKRPGPGGRRLTGKFRHDS